LNGGGCLKDGEVSRVANGTTMMMVVPVVVRVVINRAGGLNDEEPSQNK
jgi:hypothetical protein